MIRFKTHETKTHLELALSGDLTICEIKDAFDAVQPMWQQPKAVIIDLADITDLDAMGYQILLYCQVQAKTRGAKLRLVNHSRPVLAAFSRFGCLARSSGTSY